MSCQGRSKGLTSTTAPVIESRALWSDEIVRMIDATLPANVLMIEFALATGMRMGEILGLAWGDLDLSDTPAENVVAQLSRHGAERGQRVALKTARGCRRIVITAELRAKLIAHRLLSARSSDDDLVFTSRTGAPLDQRTVGRSFKAALERARLDGGIVFHWLRHTHASQLIAAGWTVADVAARLGDSIQTVMLTYAHEFDRARREDDHRARLAAMAADGSAMAARPGTVRTLRGPVESATSA